MVHAAMEDEAVLERMKRIKNKTKQGSSYVQ